MRLTKATRCAPSHRGRRPLLIASQEHSTKEHLGNETKPRLAGDELDDFRARCRGRSLPE
ncbi:MAG TPA: hypothetical protein VFZ02_01820 [Ktedonobacteraceae bacterium]